MKLKVVGIGEFQTSNDPEDILVTYSLGSCVAVVVYEPSVRVGGMLHFMLPDSEINLERAREKPAVFADTGIPLLLESCRALGADLKKLQVKLVGGAELLSSSDFFMIGKRNLTAARKILWQNGLLIKAQEVGGQVNRTVSLEIATGKVLVKIPGEGVKEI
jgi:chemotaxis protein CheD